MLNKVNHKQLQLVLQLLQSYIHQKTQNNLLNAWIKIKTIQKPNKHCFSNASFARYKTQSQKNLNKVILQSFGHIKGYKHSRTSVNDTIQKRKQLFQKIKNSIHEIKNAEMDDQFEDIVLDKIKKIQQRLQTVKSTQSNSSYGDSSSSRVWNRTQYSKDSNGEGIRFHLNARYIPMRQKLQNMESFVLQQQNYSIPSRSDSQQFQNQLIKVIETPRIGCKQSMISNRFLRVYEDPINNKKDRQIKQRLQSTGINSNVRQTFSELPSQKSSRVTNHLPLSTVYPRKRWIQEANVQNEPQIIYHPNIGNFKILPINSRQKYQSNLKKYDCFQRRNKTISGINNISQ